MTYQAEYDRLRRMGYPPYDAAVAANDRTRAATEWPESPEDRAARKAQLRTRKEGAQR